ncbi:Hsp20/alpha crystallin family protein [Candidatus Saccharibacteria bacterium]|nr:Hsp20/alpha crystallin family protein [Candidatus Saccharibacteria bacterium]
MARKTNDDMLMEDELAAAFLEDDATTMLEPDEPILSEPEEEEELTTPEEEETVEPSDEGDDGWETGEDFPGQLAVDVYETADKLVIKARTAGIKKSDLNVSIHDSILTISGVLSGGEDDQTTRWHIQECYWGEFSRTIALPVQVREDENSVKAELRDGVLTITFDKEKVEAPKVIPIQ